MFPDSMLARRFWDPKFSVDNHVDRDPDMFQLVMDYYTDQKLIIPFNIPYDRVKLEFEFFCLEPTELIIQNMNDNWRCNDKVKKIEFRLDEMVFSKEFQDKILNTIGFDIYIKKDNEELYNIFFYSLSYEIAIKYLKTKYNLSCKWYSSGLHEVTIKFTMNY